MDSPQNIIICACDTTGIMAEPFITAGWEAWLIDPDHNGRLIIPDGFRVFPTAFEEFVSDYGDQVIAEDRCKFFAAFPVCTELSYAGARWFEEKMKADPFFQVKACKLPIQCKCFAERLRCRYFIENPASVLKYAFGEPHYKFNPSDFAGYCDNEIENAYTKETWLWTGGGFEMPELKPCNPDLIFHKKDSETNMQSMDSHNERMGKSGCRTGRTRSDTPIGFVRAVFQANFGIKGLDCDDKCQKLHPIH